MEPIHKLSGQVKAHEVLFFPDAELQKVKGDQPSFAASGPLSVLYVKDYNRFFLRLNDWIYPLTRRLALHGVDKSGTSSRLYSLPTSNGFCFNLRINCHGSEQGIENFESILQEFSKFSWKGEAFTGKLDQSPDDKLTRHHKKETGMKEMISETWKHGMHSLKNKIETLKTGTSNINSRKKMMNLKTIKNKNYRKNAKSSFKKDFFQAGEKLSQEFLKLRSSNLNMIMPKSAQEMVKCGDSDVPSLYLWQDELEDAILRNRELATQGEKPTVTQSTRTVERTQERREIPTQIPDINKMPAYEGMTHYQG